MIHLESSIMNLCAFVLVIYTVLCGLYEAAYAVITVYAVLLRNSICGIVDKTVHAVLWTKEHVRKFH